MLDLHMIVPNNGVIMLIVAFLQKHCKISRLLQLRGLGVPLQMRLQKY
jgi:hypothetical protein